MSRRAFRSSPPPPMDEEQILFSELQRSLKQRWELLPTLDHGVRDVVIIPSLSLEGLELTNVQGVVHYEERMLFALGMLRHPRARVVYITSEPLHPSIVDYHLSHLQGIPMAHAKKRLTLLSTYDSSARPLTAKILERPRLVERIRRAINPAVGHMTCFTSSHLERTLAVQLGLPLYGLDPALLVHGTKGGSRRIFKEAGISHPPGIEEIDYADDVPEAINELWQRVPDAKRFVLKHAQGFSGQGNAVIDLRPIADIRPGEASSQARLGRIRAHLDAMSFNESFTTWESFGSEFDRQSSGILELFVEGEKKRSPSGQIRINPSGKLQCMSTHDQLVGGPHGQTYEGCRFPADAGYRLPVQEDAMAVGRVLQNKGVIGRAAVDFVTVEERPGVWQRYAIEINLRMSGTTHPLMILRMLSGGRFDTETGLFSTAGGESRAYVASDTVQKPQYRGLLVNDLLDIAAVHDLLYRPWTHTGVIFHMMGALSQYGKIGYTAVGRTPEEAQLFFAATQKCLDMETSK